MGLRMKNFNIFGSSQKILIFIREFYKIPKYSGEGGCLKRVIWIVKGAWQERGGGVNTPNAQL